MPLDPRAIERGTPGLAIPAQAGELERRLAGLERLLSFGAVPPRRSALPTTPRDNQEVDLVANADKLWRVRYNAAVGRWYVVGGPPLASGPAGAISMNSTTPTSPGGGPSITVPFAGYYRLEFGAYFDIQEFNTGTLQSLAGVYSGGAQVHTFGRVLTTSRGGGGGGNLTGPPIELLFFAAGAVLDFRFWGSVAGHTYYGQDFWLALYPVMLT